MSKIVLITKRERNPETGRVEEIVSHGMHQGSNRPEILPCETPQSLGAFFCNTMGEWLLDYDRPALGRA
jgi:hypothetical protein